MGKNKNESRHAAPAPGSDADRAAANQNNALANDPESVELARTRQKLENAKLESEIANLSSVKNAAWITPTALAALLPIIGTCCVFVYREVEKHNKIIQQLTEFDSVKKQKDDLEREKIDLREQKNGLNLDVMALHDLKQEQAAQVESLRQQESRLRARVEAERIIEQNGRAIERHRDYQTNELFTVISIHTFDSQGPLYNALQTILGSENVRILHVTSESIHIGALATLLAQHGVSRLELDCYGATDSEVSELGRITKLQALEVNVERNMPGATFEAVRIAQGMPELVAAEELQQQRPPGNNYTHRGMASLQSRLPRCFITYGPPSFAAALLRHSSMTREEAVHKALEEVAVVTVNDRNGTRELHIDATVTQIGGEDFLALKQIQSLKGLETRDARDSDIKFIAQLAQLETLHLLPKYREGHLSDASVRQVSGLRNLRTLTIGGSLTDVALDEISRLSKLESLTISSPFVSHRGLTMLRSIPSLQSVTLKEMALIDSSIDALAELKSLTMLNVRFAKIDDGTFARLQLRLPSCKIVRDDNPRPGGVGIPE